MIKHSEKHLVILTATVVPQVEQGLIRNDPKLRLIDYLNSIEKIEKQIKNCDADVLVVENSDNSNLILDGLMEKHIDTNRISFLSCPIDKSSSILGISSGEHGMLREVGKSFDLNSYDVIWKLTGRLGVDNLRSLLSKSSGDLRANTFFGQHHSIDSRFFGMSKALFIEFAESTPHYSERSANDQRELYGSDFKSIEYFLAYFALKAETQGYTFRSLPYLPVYRGVSGSTGKSLDGIRTRIITISLNRLRKVLAKGLMGVNP
jgi:hypothetical protein